MASASPAPQPEHSHVGLITAVIGFISTCLGLAGRRTAQPRTNELDSLSRLEARYDAKFQQLEARLDEQHRVTAEIHREIFEMLRARG